MLPLFPVPLLVLVLLDELAAVVVVAAAGTAGFDANGDEACCAPDLAAVDTDDAFVVPFEQEEAGEEDWVGASCCDCCAELSASLLLFAAALRSVVAFEGVEACFWFWDFGFWRQGNREGAGEGERESVCVCACVCACVRACACVCVCVCVCV